MPRRELRAAAPVPQRIVDDEPSTKSIGRASEVTGRTGRYANPEHAADGLIEALMDPAGREARNRTQNCRP
jgi:hypothetical protein